LSRGICRRYGNAAKMSPLQQIGEEQVSEAGELALLASVHMAAVCRKPIQQLRPVEQK
jgi:hypothetical protein